MEDGRGGMERAEADAEVAVGALPAGVVSLLRLRDGMAFAEEVGVGAAVVVIVVGGGPAGGPPIFALFFRGLLPISSSAFTLRESTFTLPSRKFGSTSFRFFFFLSFLTLGTLAPVGLLLSFSAFGDLGGGGRWRRGDELFRRYL